MNAKLDLNAAIDAYSHAMGNHMDKLKDYAVGTGVEEDVVRLAHWIRDIQDSLYRIVTETADEIGFSPDELEKIVDGYAHAENNWLNEIGKKALLRWLVWMSWHEGYLVDSGQNHIDPVVLTLTKDEVARGGDSELVNALEWLMSTDPNREAFVIVEAGDDGPFVQFAGSSAGPLIMDVPLAPLDDQQRVALAIFFSRGGLDIESDLPSYVIQIGTDTGRSIQLVDQILISLFGFSANNFAILRADKGGAIVNG